MSEYNKKTREELISICKSRGIKGYSSKKKDGIIALLDSSGTTDNMPIVKPFLKWVGGKTQILEEVLKQFPTEMENYYEPFLGGGSTLLGLLSLIKDKKIIVNGKIYASDINANLISLYKNIQSNIDQFIYELDELIEEFTQSFMNVDCPVNRKASTLEEALGSPESYYFYIRGRFNALKGEERESALASAMLLFLNKTCFRGVYRESSKGFNVPYGNYKNPSIYDETHLREVSELIKNVVFTVAPFQDSLASIEPGDFVYLDPPYAPENAKSFVSYTADGFTEDNHKQLFTCCNVLVNHGVNIVMSNADVQLVKDAFPAPRYETKIIVARRAINSKKPDATTNEVLIRSK